MTLLRCSVRVVGEEVVLFMLVYMGLGMVLYGYVFVHMYVFSCLWF